MAVVLIDADGPLFDLVGTSLKAINEYSLRKYTPQDVTMWNFLDELLTNEERKILRGLWNEKVFWKHLDITPGAVEGVESIRKAGHEIHVVTSAYESCVGWESARREALAGIYGVDKKYVTVTAQKSHFWGDAFIDDKMEHVLAWRLKHHDGLPRLFDMPHNRGDHDLPMFGWSQVGFLLDALKQERWV